uniref:Uncharacterized protein n=1 Tax=Rhizophora mucronata TaxID=61149 RepID=A0A2P2LZS4_RHIMU
MFSFVCSRACSFSMILVIFSNLSWGHLQVSIPVAFLFHYRRLFHVVVGGFRCILIGV